MKTEDSRPSDHRTLEYITNDCYRISTHIWKPSPTSRCPSPSPSLQLVVDEEYRTDAKTLIECFFQSDPEAYGKEIKKTQAEVKQDQEAAHDAHAFLFNYTNRDRYHGCSTMLHWERDISLKKVKNPMNRVLYDKVVSGYDQLISDLQALNDEEKKAGVKMEWGLVKNDSS